MARLFTPFQQFLDGNGDPLASGTLEFFESGVYSIQLDTYSDASLNNVNPNPITLDGEGYLPFDIFGDGVYSVELRDKNSILINLLDTVGGDAGSRTAFSDWTSTIIYNIPAFVVGSDGLYYRSLSTDNLGNDPIENAGSNTWWEEFKLRGIYNSSVTYSVGDVVQTSTGNLWKALKGQSGNDPETDSGTNWEPAFNEQVKEYSSSVSYGVGSTVKTSAGNLWKSLVTSNQGNNPETDSGTNWIPAIDGSKVPEVITLEAALETSDKDNKTALTYTGGGTMVIGRVNELQDGNTGYLLPAASSVDANEYLIITQALQYVANEPVVTVTGSDVITIEGGSDTSAIFDQSSSKDIRLTSNGVAEWRLTV